MEDSTHLDLAEVKLIVETALLASQEPLSATELRRLFEEDPGSDAIRNVLDELRADWEGRGVELVATASGWRFRTRPQYQPFLDRLNPQKP
ncbi:MAG TPA: SMC-Scp complex subunit ScpB, partial [Burkholderiales bacterium]|nr:SMC-Scp complex subunit ScpB [Burkholderiales bacterium]